MNWVELRALNSLYRNDKVKRNKTLDNSAVFDNHKQAAEIVEGHKFFIATDLFYPTYESRYLEKFNSYITFLESRELLKSQLKFNENDIKLLMSFEEGLQSGRLNELKQDLVKAGESIKGFSHMFFKNEKYLDKHPSLVKAINEIFEIELVDNKSQQYLYVLQCHNPKLIILCENANFLNRDKIPRENNFELWYAGGRNVPKLEYAPEIRRGLPIYYSADWDKDGLEIYELAKSFIPDLKLLHPDGESKSIELTDHKSTWINRQNPELLSGLTPELYSSKDRERIKELIRKNHWITEEGNNLKVMIDRA